MHSGAEHGFPYSLSRWTDLPASKWSWFKGQVEQGWMMAIHPRTGVPTKWSLVPGDVHELQFWTKDPRNLLRDSDLLAPYKVKIHVTVNGWGEVERGAPSLFHGAQLLRATVWEFGVDQVSWRFSPIPVVADVVTRFSRILDAADSCGLKEVYVSFLQPNDRLGDPRTPGERLRLLEALGEASKGIRVRLCNEDPLLRGQSLPNVTSGVCAPGGVGQEPCGCALAVDPFTINESCSFGCLYCYSANKQIARHRLNTTKKLPMVAV